MFLWSYPVVCCHHWIHSTMYLRSCEVWCLGWPADCCICCWCVHRGRDHSCVSGSCRFLLWCVHHRLWCHLCAWRAYPYSVRDRSESVPLVWHLIGVDRLDSWPSFLAFLPTCAETFVPDSLTTCPVFDCLHQIVKSFNIGWSGVSTRMLCLSWLQNCTFSVCFTRRLSLILRICKSQSNFLILIVFSMSSCRGS